MKTAITASNLSCQRGGRTVITSINLDVHYGEVLILVGPNGAGKSTLLSALSGDVAPNDGSVLSGGCALTQWAARDLAQQRAVLLQHNHVSFGFTVAEVVAMGRHPWPSVNDAEDQRILAQAIRYTDIADLVHRKYSELSGGERARVSLARVLAQDTPIVMLDEPTAALDLRHQEDVMALCRTLARRGRAVVVVVHDLSLASAWADRIAILDHGQLRVVGPPEDVLTSDLITDVYGLPVDIIRTSPGQLLVIPVRDVPAAADTDLPLPHK